MEETFLSFNFSNLITVNLMLLVFALVLGLLAAFYHQMFGVGNLTAGA